MWLYIGLFALVNISLQGCAARATVRKDVRYFPDGFMFGVATASYQVEGAWSEDGKSENIWDHLTHNQPPCVIVDCSTGDVATDSYHNIQRDVEMIRELGLDYYKFSLSWTRILPSSFPDKINEQGVDYYNKLINKMLKYNIQPMVTLYHGDLPQKLQDMGGWTNPNIGDWFADYAGVAFELFGDRVKRWITINEPREICYQGYGETSRAPVLNITGMGEYLCAKNLIVAHAKAYHLYNDEYRSLQGGQIGITIGAQYYEPESEEHTTAAEEYTQFDWGIYSNPIFSETGDFPQLVKDTVLTKSLQQGFKRSRLPKFTDDEVDFVRGTSDFFGLNHFSTYLVYRNESLIGNFPEPSMFDDANAIRYQPKDWPHGASNGLKVVPNGFYKLLTKIREDYNNPPVFITENGYSSFGGLFDEERIDYMRTYLEAMLDAIEEGSDVRTYTAWSLMDNFEWMGGYQERFGLFEVDYASPLRTRTPRKSAFVYKQIVRTRQLDFGYEPKTMTMTIDEGH